MKSLKIYTDKDINKDLIKSKKIAVIGFGSQGYGQGLNLKDSGCDVVIGVRQGGASDIKAKDYGLKTMSISDAVKQADIIQILIPDEVQAEVYEKEIKPYLKAGQYLMFSHGFNIHYGFIKAPENINVTMVAPKAPGHTVRSEYKDGRGVPSLIAVAQDYSGDSKEAALSYASAIGSGRAGIIETTFREETETDLFGEQAVLCGGCSALIKTAFETLVEAGYSPYMAYFEVCHELKLIVDLIYQGGIEDMHYSISNNAEYGDLTRGNRLINSGVKAEMKNILSDIQSGKYANEFMDEMQNGGGKFKELRTASQNHLIEKIGQEIRSSFSWNNDNKLIDRSRN
ncbi:TPA: ketol-acid reductoisomerase [Candidatus Gastranaerophilales bacterium HUM_16]|nr:MAG TPA: ketol-acid reductoisomerase [Candidatus Gastranaerophilales bacterium HUM_16]